MSSTTSLYNDTFTMDCIQVSATYADGYRVVAVCPVIGPRAVEKAQKTAEAIIKRYNIKATACQVGCH